MSKITIVDENDDVIGIKERDEVTSADIYRATGLWITNSKGEILLAQRSFNKSHSPGKWAPAVAGTVEENESYEQNIYKEAEEEMGIVDIKFELGPKWRTSNKYNYFAQIFTVVLDWPLEKFKVDYREAEQIKWFRKDELIKEITACPRNFTSAAPRMLSVNIKIESD
ncbi:TPA: NUDIX domain-containing protein [Candidatus Berkelbacteria bacterium]|uniref:Isopentenyl-diphosphate delta-isomerase, isopentenyl-diphosphate delta-isomerase n=1 Tax=Berkelbacteria bacterium GW2011_GWE1_39_12 TaxID=1618337 RepID=A0A0G4B6J1_9BACT|nr:MAG: isopentenyl-diphosphate delta-isomerase, isopentenyl-diphosphate delta-isomerase [Berkelbacteria bacterium GW2011_GWE1_39_12]HBO60286.1 NUDIX domain-containing protein [Candidatus Berkelbacteria bacterium]